MERFVLTTRRDRAGRLLVRLEMLSTDRRAVVLERWELKVQADNERLLMVLEAAELAGALANAERPAHLGAFDGGRKSFLDLLHTHCGHGFPSAAGFPGVGEWGLLNRDGMRLALAFVLAGRCNTVGKRRAAAAGLAKLPEEVVLYWFTLCLYGTRTRAGRAALMTLVTAKGD